MFNEICLYVLTGT